MKKKKYYAFTTSMTFEKTVLVPIDSVENINEAMDLVDANVETCHIDLFDEAYCETKQSSNADENGFYELTDEEATSYQIIDGDKKESLPSVESMKGIDSDFNPDIKDKLSNYYNEKYN